MRSSFPKGRFHPVGEMPFWIHTVFTPLEIPPACSGDEGNLLIGTNTGFHAPCEPSR